MAQVKTKDQIEKIKKACQETDAIFSKIINNFKFKTEIELRDFILSEIKNRGLTPSFPPIVTSGKRAGGDIHPKPTNKKLSGFTIIDFGVIYNKYMSDMTRTIFVGIPTKEEKDIYHKLQKSQSMSIKNTHAGVNCHQIDALARKILGDMSKYFIHTLGHGVGTKIHEDPKIYYKLMRPVFKENMVITIEPGLYIKNKGGLRIEDTCLITKKECIPLTNSKRNLLIF